jgi:hypothetical protein
MLQVGTTGIDGQTDRQTDKYVHASCLSELCSATQ